MTPNPLRSFIVEEAVLLRWGIRVPAPNALEAMAYVRALGFTEPATVREIKVEEKERAP